MNKLILGSIFLFVLAFFPFNLMSIQIDGEANKGRHPIKLEGKEALYLKLLSRPFSKIYENPNIQKVKIEKVDTFKIFFAYTTPMETPGFYEVGINDRGETIGFMKETDVIEWKHYLTLAFTNKEDKYTLFFESLIELENVLYNQNRYTQVQNIRENIQGIIQGKPYPDNFPIIAVEPTHYFNIFENPYLLPILDFKQISFQGYNSTRLLKIASTVKGHRRLNDKISKRNIEGASHVSKNEEMIKSFKADVVFVIDTTTSMQKYIETTRVSVKKISEAISDIDQNISFGLVAYRDDPNRAPGLEYRTKIFCDLEDGKDINLFLKKLGKVQEAKFKSIGFNEDVWAGIYTAIKDGSELKRREDSTLFIIQIGDAGAHDRTGFTKLNAEDIQQFSEDQYGKTKSRVWIFSIHLKTPEAKRAKNIKSAEKQFRTVVSRIPGYEFYYPIENGDPIEFQKQTTILLKTFIHALNSIKQGYLPNLPIDTDKREKREIDLGVKAAIRAAVLEHIGSKKTKLGTAVPPPRDIKAWVLDRDLMDPGFRPMKIMLLITRNHLDKLRTSLKNLLLAARIGEVSSEDLFDQLNSLMGSAFRDPEMIDKGVVPGNLTLGKMGLLPEFIKDLPYKTDLMHFPIEEWRTIHAAKQKPFLDKIYGKIALYEEYYKNNDIWIELNEGDSPGDHVTFLEIDRLP
jgi:hypothetical protein